MTTSANLFFMAGTEGTGEYMVPLATSQGAVGYRCLSGERFRLRVEPVGDDVETLAAAFPSPDWKQPGQGGQHRFSTVISGGYEALAAALTKAVAALSADQPGQVTFIQINPDAPQWVRQVVESTVKSTIVAELRRRKVPGANAASRWSLTTLVAKLA